IDPQTLNINPEEIEKKISPRTKAIIAVHYAGQPCDMDAINKIAGSHNLLVIEDAAHAIGARYKGKMVGTLGDIASFSFYATKNLTTGEGGMVTTDNDELAEKIRVLSLHGISRDAWKRYSAEGSWYYEVLYPGFKYNMTDIEAALGIHQLSKVEWWRELREEYAAYYDREFAGIGWIRLPGVIDGAVHGRHLYVIMLEDRAPVGRDELIKEMGRMNVGTSVHFIPVHLHPYYRKTFGYGEGMLPVTEDVFKRIVSLPLYPAMAEEDLRYVVDVVKGIVG
ncbi:MAG: UDP-4-amino-4,6-dideoxy-N-acetyl-beta-L-altrosamine transaminase, partial [Methanomicrobiales archaeon HGW-Methanomicrobiales-5]